MPKKIEQLKPNIMAAASTLLQQDGYDALTIRAVANECHIAVGTVYNYFPNKEMLAAGVMLEDWMETLDKMQKACAEASSLEQAVRIVYRKTLAFAKKYRSAWSTYAFTNEKTLALKQRHKKLVEQIGSCLKPLIKGRQISSHDEYFLAENILSCVSGSQISIEDLIAIIVQLERNRRK
jgi:AcrR family transcriptional regulator